MSESIFLETWSSDNVPEAWRTAGRKDLDAIFDDAANKLAQLEVNPLWGHEKQTAEIRKDAAAILEQLREDVRAHLNAPTDYLKPEGE